MNWEFTFFIFYLNTLCNSYISDIVLAFCSKPNIKVSYSPFILVKYSFMYSAKLKFSLTCLLFYVDNLISIYPDIENNPSRDLGPASFSYYLNIFFSKSKSLQSKNYSRSLHFNYFFIIKVFKNDYRNNICLFIVAGSVSDNLEHLSKWGIWVVGKNFINRSLRLSKSLSLLLTSMFSGLTVTKYSTYLGTKTLGLII